MSECKRHRLYFELIQARPELFRESKEISIVLDLERIKEYESENSTSIGVIYQSDFNMLLVDLIQAEDESLYTFERLVPSECGKPIVAITMFEGRFVLLNQFRHALRASQLCFPRGFGEPNISSEENLKKEIWEELGSEVIKYRLLGKVSGDSGISSSIADVYFAEITQPNLTFEEGITDIKFLDENQLKQLISQGIISDGFTLSAFCLYMAKKGDF